MSFLPKKHVKAPKEEVEAARATTPLDRPAPVVSKPIAEVIHRLEKPIVLVRPSWEPCKICFQNCDPVTLDHTQVKLAQELRLNGILYPVGFAMLPTDSYGAYRNAIEGA